MEIGSVAMPYPPPFFFFSLSLSVSTVISKSCPSDGIYTLLSIFFETYISSIKAAPLRIYSIWIDQQPPSLIHAYNTTHSSLRLTNYRIPQNGQAESIERFPIIGVLSSSCYPVAFLAALLQKRSMVLLHATASVHARISRRDDQVSFGAGSLYSS